MANPKVTEKKKIKLHPLDSKGKQIKDVTVYPETSIDSVKDINTGEKLDQILETLESEIKTAGTQADWTETNPDNPAYIRQKPELKPVATSGKFEDLDFAGADITHLPNQKDGKGVYVKKVKITEESGTTDLTPANANGEVTIDLTGYAHKSNTEGLIKNDGTIDTTQYAPKGTIVAGKDLSIPQANIQPYYYTTTSNDYTYTLKTEINITSTEEKLIVKANNSENAATLSFVAWPENPNLFVLYYKNGDKEAYYYDNQWIDTTKTPIAEQLTFTIDLTGTIYDELNFRKIVTSSPEGTTVGQKINGLVEKLPDLYAAKSNTYTKAEVNDKESNLQSNINTERARAEGVEALKADKDDTYTKSDVYNKTEVNNLLDTKQDTIDSEHTLDVSLISGLGSAATGTLDTGSHVAGQIPVINQDGQLDSAIIPQVTGQMIYGGNVSFEDEQHIGEPYATLTTHAKHKLNTDLDNIVLTNTTDPITGYPDNEGIYYIVNNNGTFAGNNYISGDWILSNATSWSKVANSSSVTDIRIDGNSILNGATGIANFVTNQSNYDASTNKIATMQDVNVKANITDVNTALDAKADKTDTYTKSEINASLETKVDKEITSDNGTAKILNEADGGGAMFEGASTKSYLGVHDGTGPQDAAGKYLTGQIYAKDKIATEESGSWKGAKLNLYTDGFYYTKNRGTGGETADQEIATKGDITVKGIQKNGTDLTPDENGKVNITVPNVNVNDVQINKTSIVDANGIANVPEQVNADWNANSGYAQILNKPDIPTKTTVQNWGFYEKPNGGIPENDLDTNTKTKIDGAIQNTAGGATQIENLGFIKRVDAENIVDANPSVGSESPTLNSIRIKGTSYKIEGGGGGGGDVPSSRKVGGVTLEQDTADLRNYKYEDSTETKRIPASGDELVDNTTYTVLQNYNFNDFNEIFSLLSRGKADVYEDAENDVLISFYAGPETQAITISSLEDSENYYTYVYEAANPAWYDYSDPEQDPTPLSTLPSVTINFENIISGAPIDVKTMIARIFIPAHNETIIVNQTMQEKVEDLPNWIYEKTPITKIIPGLETGAEYKINFNPVNNYTGYLTPALTAGSYDDHDNSLYIGYDSCTYYGLHIGTYNGNDHYYLQFDLSDPTKLVVWRKGSSQSNEEWSQADLDNITVKWYANGVNQSRDPQLMDDLLKVVFKNTDGSAITSFVEGTTYKFNTNAIEYRNIFDTLYENFYNGGSSNIYNYYASDSYLAYLEVYSYSYQNTPYINYNNNYFYLVPSISETYYPGRWSKQSDPWSDPSNYYYTAQELLEVPTFIFNRNYIQSWPKSEEFLHKFLLNADGTAIKEDEEIITGYETKSLKENLDNYKNWKYEDAGQGIFDIPEWYKLSDISVSASGPFVRPTIIYNSPDIQITVSNSAGIIGVTIIPSRGSTESFNYSIMNQDISQGGVNAKANIWYSYDQQTETFTEIETPKFICSDQYVVDYTHFEAVYGNKVITLGQKIDKLSAEKGAYLKDQIYDKVIEEVSMESARTDQDVLIALKDGYDYGTVMSIFEGVINIESVSRTDLIWENNNKCIIPMLNYNPRTGALMGMLYYVDLSSNDIAMIEAGTLISSFNAFDPSIENGRWMNGLRLSSNVNYITQENLPRFTFDELAEGEFRPFPLSAYAITEYNLLDTEPEDWADYYYNYYYYDSEDDKYYHIDAQETPTFEQDMYYERVNHGPAGTASAPMFEQYKYAEVYYDQLNEEPDDWVNNWMRYFIYYEGQYSPIITYILNNSNNNSSDDLPTLPPDFDELSEAVGVYEMDYDTLDSEPDNWNLDWPDYYDITIAKQVMMNILFSFKEVEQKLKDTPLADKLYGKGTGQVPCYYLDKYPSSWDMSTGSFTSPVYSYNGVTISYRSGSSQSSCWYIFEDSNSGIHSSCDYGQSWPDSVLSIPLYEEGSQSFRFNSITHSGTTTGETIVTVAEKVADIKNWEYEKTNINFEYEYDLPGTYTEIGKMTAKTVYQVTGFTAPAEPQVQENPSDNSGGIEYIGNGPATITLAQLAENASIPLTALQIKVIEEGGGRLSIKYIQVIDSNGNKYGNMGNGWYVTTYDQELGYVNNQLLIVNANDDPIALPIELPDNSGVKDDSELKDILGIKTKTVETQVNSLYYQLVTENIPAPTAPNATGRLIIVLYNDEELVETKYDGYLYFFVDGDLSFYEAMFNANNGTSNGGSSGGSSGGGIVKPGGGMLAG